MVRDDGPSGESRILTDRETVRRWADRHDAVPVEYEDGPYGLVSDPGPTARRTDWTGFFEHVERNDYVVVYHEGAAEPFEVTRRSPALERYNTPDQDLERRLGRDETSMTAAESNVVKTTVREQATAESELVDTEVLDHHVLEVRLLDRRCTRCDLVDEETGTAREWFDEDAYLETFGTREGQRTDAEHGARALDVTDEFPYAPELDVQETWAVTRELTERFTVESRVIAHAREGSATDRDRDVDLDLLQDSILRSDLLAVDGPAEKATARTEVESEFVEDDLIRTFVTRERTVEDRVTDSKRLRADVSDGEALGIEVTETRDVTEAVRRERAAAAESRAGASTRTTAGETVEGTREVVLSEGEVGKPVVDGTGEEIGTVASVSDDGTRMRVDVSQALTERVKSTLNWGDDEEEYRVHIDRVAHVYEDQVMLEAAPSR